MNEFNFTLKFGLTNAPLEPGAYIERLGEEGCDDALIPSMPYSAPLRT
jgi:hypothetical protein